MDLAIGEPRKRETRELAPQQQLSGMIEGDCSRLQVFLFDFWAQRRGCYCNYSTQQFQRVYRTVGDGELAVRRMVSMYSVDCS